MADFTDKNGGFHEFLCFIYGQKMSLAAWERQSSYPGDIFFQEQPEGMPYFFSHNLWTTMELLRQKHVPIISHDFPYKTNSEPRNSTARDF